MEQVGYVKKENHLLVGFGEHIHNRTLKDARGNVYMHKDDANKELADGDWHDTFTSYKTFKCYAENEILKQQKVEQARHQAGGFAVPVSPPVCPQSMIPAPPACPPPSKATGQPASLPPQDVRPLSPAASPAAAPSNDDSPPPPAGFDMTSAMPLADDDKPTSDELKNKDWTQNHDGTWKYTGTDAYANGQTAQTRRLAVASPHRAQADEIGFHYAGTMIGGFSVVALVGAYLYRRFLRSTKPEHHREL